MVEFIFMFLIVYFSIGLFIGIVMQKILDGKITIDLDLFQFVIVWPYFFWEMIK